MHSMYDAPTGRAGIPDRLKATGEYTVGLGRAIVAAWANAGPVDSSFTNLARSPFATSVGSAKEDVRARGKRGTSTGHTRHTVTVAGPLADESFEIETPKSLPQQQHGEKKCPPNKRRTVETECTVVDLDCTVAGPWQSSSNKDGPGPPCQPKKRRPRATPATSPERSVTGPWSM